MFEASTPIDRDEAMLARLAELDLALTERVAACALAAEAPAVVADLARACQRVARSLRQTLALKARLKHNMARELRDNPPAPPPRDTARIRRRMDDLRGAVRRVIWDEYEPCEDEGIADCFFDLLEQRMALHAENDAFGLEPLDDHVVRLCHELGLTTAAARAWRDLPDPPQGHRADDAADDALEGEARLIESSA